MINVKELEDEKEKEELEDTIINYGIIEIENCYDFWKFIKGLNQFTYETEFKIEEEKLVSCFMDASRISLNKMEMNLTERQVYDTESDKHYNAMVYDFKVGVNLDDLVKILKCRKGDNRQLRIKFYDYNPDIPETHYIYIEKINEDNIIKKRLKPLDIDLEEIPIENLLSIEYPSSVRIESKQLENYFYEAGQYSDIVELSIEKKGLFLRESGQIGDFEFKVENSKLYEKEIGIKKGKLDIQKSAYSLSFLKSLKPLIKYVLSDSETLTLHLKTDTPIRFDIEKEELENLEFKMFLAPRVEDEDTEFEEDYDDF
jgi:hypothetical protein